MSAIVNIFVCIVIPLLLLLIVADKNTRSPVIFLILGMLAALVSVFLNALAMIIYNYDNLQIGLYVAPITEEVLKVIPLIIYVLIKKPTLRKSIVVAVTIGVGFATIENIVYLITYGVSDFSFILVRGFSTGIMHTITLCLFAVFLYRVSRLNLLREIFVFIGVFSFAAAFHGLFNLLVNADSPVAVICGYFLPPVVAIGIIIFLQWKNISAFFQKVLIRKKTA